MIKKTIILLFTLFSIICGTHAQNTFPIYFWHNNGVHMETSDELDSVTFVLPDDLFTLSTGDAINFTDSTMLANYDVTAKSYNIPDWFGVCYSHKTETPTIKDELTWTIGNSDFKRGGTTEKTINIEGLISGTTYYYRPYVVFDHKIFYGPVKNFTTLGTKPKSDDSFVDLGLSVKWAACNLGADQPYEFGDYYAWGETERKDFYTEDNYKFGKDSTFYKYNGEDGRNILDSEDDIATIALGYPCRIPDINEINELIIKCSWTNDVLRGISGVKITGPNGNSIFLPFNHQRYWNPWGYGDSYRLGHIWSNTKIQNQAFSMTYDDYCGWLSFRNYYFTKSNRFVGICIRPVKP